MKQAIELDGLPPDLRAVLERALPKPEYFDRLEAEQEAERERQAEREQRFLEAVADKAAGGEFGPEAQQIAREVLADGGRSHVNLTRLAKALREAKRQKQLAARAARKRSSRK
jgi:hypothetical protein